MLQRKLKFLTAESLACPPVFAVPAEYVSSLTNSFSLDSCLQVVELQF